MINPGSRSTSIAAHPAGPRRLAQRLLSGSAHSALLVPLVLSLGISLPSPAPADTQLPGTTGGIPASYGTENTFHIVSGTTIDNRIYGDTSRTWTLSNAGLVSAGTAVLLKSANGTVTNTGTIHGTSNAGIYFEGGGTVANTGSSALIEGQGAAITIKGGAGTVANAGIILGTNIGIYLGAGGYVANTGSSALIAGGSFGVKVNGGAGTVANAGTILGTSSVGVYLRAGGSVANMGSSALIAGARTGIYIVGREEDPGLAEGTPSERALAGREYDFRVA